MLAAVGTRDFYHHAVELYGRPASLTADRRTTNLDLARALHAGGRRRRRARADPQPARRAGVHGGGGGAAAGGALRALLPGRSTSASSWSTTSRPRRRPASTASASSAGGRFSRRDLAQLEFHEGHVHVATALNGRAQPVMSFIGYPSPRTTGDAGGAGGADRVPDPVDQPGAAAPPRRPHAGDQDGRGRRRLLRALSVLPGARPRRDRRPTTARAGSAAAVWSRAARRSPRTSATWTACCG